MDMCVVDWTATAAWVQAVGSIGAILVAVWIGNRQHRQNLEFVNDERIRTEAAHEQYEAERAERAAELSAIVVRPLRELEKAGSEACQLTNKFYGTTETPDENAKKHILDVIAKCEDVKEELKGFQDLYAGNPRHLRAFGRVLRTVDSFAKGFAYVATDIEQRQKRDKFRMENPQLTHAPVETFDNDVLSMALWALGEEYAYFVLK